MTRAMMALSVCRRLVSLPARCPRATLASGLLLLAALGSSIWPAPRPGNPVAALLLPDRELHDFGMRSPGDKVETSFTLRNPSRRPIEIQKLDASCGCAKPKVSARIVPPHGEILLTAPLQLPMTVGAIRHSLLVFTNADPGRPLRLMLSATTQFDIDVRPTIIARPVIAPAEGVTETITFFYPKGTPYLVTGWQVSSPCVSVTRESSDRVRISLPADLKTGRIAESVTFQTNCPARPAIVIPIEGDKLGHMSVAPSALVLEQQKPGATVTRRLFVRDAKQRPLRERLRDVQTNDPNLKIARWQWVGAPPAAASAVMEVTFQIPKASGLYNSVLKLSVNQGREIEVPVCCTVEP